MYRELNIKKKVSKEEYNWCKDKQIDPYVLREIDILKIEIIFRFRQLGLLFERIMRSPEKNYLKIKLAYASAFYRYIIKAQIPQFDEGLAKRISKVSANNELIDQKERIVIIKSHIINDSDYMKHNKMGKNKLRMGEQNASVWWN